MEAYLNPRVGFVSEAKFKQKLNKDVSVSSFNVAQVFATKRPTYASIKADKVGKLVMDLIDVSNYSPMNRGVKYILTIIDIHSRFAWAYPLKSKQPESLLKPLKATIDEITKRYPNNTITIASDDGKEYKGDVERYLKSQQIEHFKAVSSESNKSYMTAHIESFNRTLINMIKRLQLVNKLQYVDHLDDLIANYNTTYHSRIKMTPSEIFIDKQQTREDLTNHFPDDLKIGDYVRLKLPESKFAKRNQKFSSDIYEVVGREGYRYQVMGDNGVLKTTYLPRHLLKVNRVVEVPLNESVIKANVVRTKKKRLQQRSDIGKVNDKGDVIIDKRLQPTKNKRVVKKPVRIDL